MSGFFASIIRYYHSVRYLRTEQIFFRLYYPLKRRFRIPRERSLNGTLPPHPPGLTLPVPPRATACYFPETNGFCFLGERCDFGKQVDWTAPGKSRLWRFHLYYFDWLRDDTISKSFRLNSIFQFIDNHKNKSEYNHAYPTALRLRNWIAFLMQYGLGEERINSAMYRDALLLYRFPEYDIGGNHLLESGLSLLWAGHYFGRVEMQRKAANILQRELNRQILADGSHYERSIAYHTFIQKNIFETLLFLQHLGIDDFLFKNLKNKFLLMLSHLKLLSGSDGIVPHFGDSNPGMMEWTREMDFVAQDLSDKLGELPQPAAPVGLKLMEWQSFRLFFLRGKLLSTDQPGHSHADTFSFCLNVKGVPCIVDPGVSVYEPGALRDLQRSTLMHNTLSVGAFNSSELWASFRMARRAEVVTLSESDFFIDSQHDGYLKSCGIMHRRSVQALGRCVCIRDEWWGSTSALPELRLMLHFHPERRPEIRFGELWLEDCGLRIRVEGALLSLESYDYCEAFGKTRKSFKLNALVCSNKIETLIERFDE